MSFDSPKPYKLFLNLLLPPPNSIASDLFLIMHCVQLMASTHLGLGPSAEACSAHQESHSLRKQTLPPQAAITLDRYRAHEFPLTHAGTLTDSFLCRYCVDNHSWCEFPEFRALFSSGPPWLLPLKILLPLLWWVCGEGMWYRRPIYGWALHRHLITALWPVLSFQLEHCPPNKKILWWDLRLVNV